MTERLPKGVYFKHGAYYLVRANRWLRIGRKFDEATYQELLRSGAPSDKTVDSEIAAMQKYLRRKWHSSKNQAAARGYSFSLSFDDVTLMIERQRCCCALSGIVFSLDLHDGRSTPPFAPSIDRIDNAKGYSKDNCRLVAVMANIAKNQWSDETFKRLVSKIKMKNLDALDENPSKTGMVA